MVLITNALYNCSNYLGGSSCVYYIKIQKVVTTLESDFLRAADVSKMLGCSMSTAYRLMRKIRAELDSKGLITLAGIVPKHYFMERMGVDYRG